ncbi:hypothetical protein MMC25_002951 [Agyrium rufum]|nr:hypothetical protein [Agyrium rufum]
MTTQTTTKVRVLFNGGAIPTTTSEPALTAIPTAPDPHWQNAQSQATPPLSGFDQNLQPATPPAAAHVRTTATPPRTATPTPPPSATLTTSQGTSVTNNAGIVTPATTASVPVTSTTGASSATAAATIGTVATTSVNPTQTKSATAAIPVVVPAPPTAASTTGAGPALAPLLTGAGPATAAPVQAVLGSIQRYPPSNPQIYLQAGTNVPLAVTRQWNDELRERLYNILGKENLTWYPNICMAGKGRTRIEPTLVVVCTKQEGCDLVWAKLKPSRLHVGERRRSYTKKLEKAGIALRVILDPRMGTLGSTDELGNMDLEIELAWDAEAFSVVGQSIRSIKHPDVSATLSTLLLIDGELYALSVGHPFVGLAEKCGLERVEESPELEPQAMVPSTVDDSKTSSMWSDSTSPSQSVWSDSISPVPNPARGEELDPNRKDGTLIDTSSLIKDNINITSNPASAAEGHTSTSELENTTQEKSANSQAQPMGPLTVAVMPEPTYQKLGSLRASTWKNITFHSSSLPSHGAKSQEFGSDWALIKVCEGWMATKTVPDTSKWNSIVATLPYDESISQRQVLIVSPGSRVTKGAINGCDTTIGIEGCMFNVSQISLLQGLHPGDSGSIVVDLRTLEVLGVVIVGGGFLPWVFMLSIPSILADIASKTSRHIWAPPTLDIEHVLLEQKFRLYGESRAERSFNSLHKGAIDRPISKSAAVQESVHGSELYAEGPATKSTEFFSISGPPLSPLAPTRRGTTSGLESGFSTSRIGRKENKKATSENDFSDEEEHDDYYSRLHRTAFQESLNGLPPSMALQRARYLLESRSTSLSRFDINNAVLQIQRLRMIHGILTTKTAKSGDLTSALATFEAALAGLKLANVECRLLGKILTQQERQMRQVEKSTLMQMMLPLLSVIWTIKGRWPRRQLRKHLRRLQDCNDTLFSIALTPSASGNHVRYNDTRQELANLRIRLEELQRSIEYNANSHEPTTDVSTKVHRGLAAAPESLNPTRSQSYLNLPWSMPEEDISLEDILARSNLTLPPSSDIESLRKDSSASLPFESKSNRSKAKAIVRQEQGLSQSEAPLSTARVDPSLKSHDQDDQLKSAPDISVDPQSFDDQSKILHEFSDTSNPSARTREPRISRNTLVDQEISHRPEMSMTQANPSQLAWTPPVPTPPSSNMQYGGMYPDISQFGSGYPPPSQLYGGLQPIQQIQGGFPAQMPYPVPYVVPQPQFGTGQGSQKGYVVALPTPISTPSSQPPPPQVSSNPYQQAVYLPQASPEPYQRQRYLPGVSFNPYQQRSYLPRDFAQSSIQTAQVMAPPDKLSFLPTTDFTDGDFGVNADWELFTNYSTPDPEQSEGLKEGSNQIEEARQNTSSLRRDSTEAPKESSRDAAEQETNVYTSDSAATQDFLGNALSFTPAEDHESNAGKSTEPAIHNASDTLQQRIAVINSQIDALRFETSKRNDSKDIGIAGPAITDHISKDTTESGPITEQTGNENPEASPAKHHPLPPSQVDKDFIRRRRFSPKYQTANLATTSEAASWFPYRPRFSTESAEDILTVDPDQAPSQRSISRRAVRPTYIRVQTKHIDPVTADHFKLPWEYDSVSIS